MTHAEVIARLEKLERDNRRLKRSGLIALAVLAGIIAIAATRPVPQVIKAHQFDLVDDIGATRASLGFTAYEPRLWLHAYKGPKITISTLVAPEIELSSNKGVAKLYVVEGFPHLELADGHKDWTDVGTNGIDLKEGEHNRLIVAGAR